MIDREGSTDPFGVGTVECGHHHRTTPESRVSSFPKEIQAGLPRELHVQNEKVHTPRLPKLPLGVLGAGSSQHIEAVLT